MTHNGAVTIIPREIEPYQFRNGMAAITAADVASLKPTAQGQPITAEVVRQNGVPVPTGDGKYQVRIPDPLRSRPDGPVDRQQHQPAVGGRHQAADRQGRARRRHGRPARPAAPRSGHDAGAAAAGCTVQPAAEAYDERPRPDGEHRRHRPDDARSQRPAVDQRRPHGRGVGCRPVARPLLERPGGAQAAGRQDHRRPPRHDRRAAKKSLRQFADHGRDPREPRPADDGDLRQAPREVARGDPQRQGRHRAVRRPAAGLPRRRQHRRLDRPGERRPRAPATSA